MCRNCKHPDLCVKSWGGLLAVIKLASRRVYGRLRRTTPKNMVQEVETESDFSLTPKGHHPWTPEEDIILGILNQNLTLFVSKIQ
jgi:hypothetical protein